MKMTDEQIEGQFKAVACRAGELFKDYLILARLDNGGIIWKASDSTWARGAADRYRDLMSSRDEGD